MPLFAGLLSFPFPPGIALGCTYPWALCALVWLPVLGLTYYLTVLLHELGHLLAGLLTGHRLHIFKVGPVVLQKVGRRMGLRWQGGFNALGGFTVMQPPQGVALSPRMFLLTLGGPLISLLSVPTALLLKNLVLPAADVAFHVWVGHQMFGGLAFFSAVLTLLSLWPRQVGLLRTDGARLLLLARPGRAREQELLFLKQFQSSVGGTRPRNYDRPRLLRLMEMGAPYAPYARLYLYFQAYDCGQIGEARSHLATAKAEMEYELDFLSQYFEWEWAFFLAFTQDDAYHSGVWPDTMKGLIEPGTQARYRAMQAVSLGQAEAARQQVALARRRLPGQLEQGIRFLEEEWVAQIAARLNEDMSV